ncbi:MAG TPA: HD family hydrolase [Thermoflexia bacterium]|nr:HD family hydrolase [Thermoflexia bacterium]
MDPETALSFLHTALGLKRVPRTGWLLRGLTDVESVAEHAWGVALVVLTLAPGVDSPLDREKALIIALIHDLPERSLSDIPSPALAHLPPEVKREAEEAALAEMMQGLPDTPRLRAWWREFEEESTPEGRLVRDADRLEMLFQAYLYEEGRGVRLDDFWANQEGRPFHFSISQAVYEALVRARAARQRGTG